MRSNDRKILSFREKNEIFLFKRMFHLLCLVSGDDLFAFLSSSDSASTLPSINTMMLSNIPPTHSPKKKGTSPKVRKEPGGIIKAKTVRKTKKETIFHGESLQQILIKSNGEFVEPMQIVLASPVKSQPITTSYSPIAPATNKKNVNESHMTWINTNISQSTKNAQALALKAVARNQVAKINQQQQQVMDTGTIFLMMFFQRMIFLI